jgi:tetratricopeptide (TPR) repeat protein
MPSATEAEKEAKANLLRQRVVLLVSLRRWQDAASDCQQVIDLDPSASDDWWRLALLRLELGDEAGYRDGCEKMLLRFRELRGTDNAGRMAQISLLRPASGRLLANASEFANFAEASGQDPRVAPACRFAKGLAEYRQGRFASAADWMQKVIGQPDLTFGDKPYAPREVAAHSVLAMAQQQLGQPDAGRAALAKAEEVFQAQSLWPKHPIVDYDRLIAQILLREARSVLGEPKATRSPPAQ